MFSRIRPPGEWTLNSVVDPAEWETFDENQSNAIDGLHGGVYAPDNEIEIGGDGLKVSGPFTAASTMQVNGDATLSNDVLLDGPSFTVSTVVATFNAGVSFNDAVDFNGTANFDDNVTFNDPVSFTDTATFGAGLHVDAGDATFDEDLTVTGLATL